MNVPPTLFAKSVQKAQAPLTLAAHLDDTWRTARALFGTESRVREAFAIAFRLTPRERALFMPTLEVSCLAHDIGKANEEFYTNMVSGCTCQQTMRHEHLSAIFLYEPHVRAWLAESTVIDFSVIVAAVLGHHMKADNREGTKYSFGVMRFATALRLYFDHAEVRQTLEKIAHVAGLRSIPVLQCAAVINQRSDNAWASCIDGILCDSRKLATRMREENVSGLYAAVKAALIACDSVASASFRNGFSPEAWSSNVAARARVTAADVERDIIAPRVAYLKEQGTWKDWHAFQLKTAELPHRALLRVGCGGGKTLAAYRWCAEQAQARDVAHVVFLYPTQGTATEGFRDYVGWAPETDARLLHSGADEAIVGMLRNRPPSLQQRLGAEEVQDEAEAGARLFGLALWRTRYFAATVDQFLSFLENDYQGVVLLPVLLDSVIVIDEVHAFDRKMFGSLLTMLRKLDLPVLMMTATISETRRRALEDLGVAIYPTAADRKELRDLEAAESRLRYTHLRSTRRECVAHAVGAVASPIAGRGARVLWVCNTVSRCIEVAQELRRETGCRILIYHSRFTLCDRQRIHEEVVTAFASDAVEPIIAVTTQVCEMSLDMDADVLITEDAPMAALIQRLGRVSRKHGRPDAYRAPIYTYAPEDNQPYHADELALGRKLFSAAESQMSQQGLEERMMELQVGEPVPPDIECASYFGGGFMATTQDYRLIEDRDCTAVLDSTLPKLNATTLRRHTLSVPWKQVQTHAGAVERPRWLPSWVQIADGSRYDEYGYDTRARKEQAEMP